MPQLTKPHDTGSVEVVNSVINMYASKRQHFELNVMDARVKLAVIYQNNNLDKQQDVAKQQRKNSGKVGEKKWKQQCVKVSKDWTAKPVMEPKSYKFISDLLSDIVQKKISGININQKRSEKDGFLTSPKNIASTE